MRLDRREFLKLATLLSASSTLSPVFNLKPTKISSNPKAQNILIILFDAFSACNISFHGYPRETMPKLSRLLERAVVYHHHYAGGNYTTPGTASLLTGTLPWTHRMIKFDDYVYPEVIPNNIFHLFDDYYRIAYTHNPLAEHILRQFSENITLHKPLEDLFLSTTWWINRFFKDDYDTASLSWDRTIDTNIDGYLYSLIFFEYIQKFLQNPPTDYEDLFPKGLPTMRYKNNFLLEHAVDWIQESIKNFIHPYIGYFHLYPPHEPYNTRREFVDAFLNDGWEPQNKAFHPLSPHNQTPREDQLSYRREYDEFILYVDYEFDRLFSFLEQEGILENTWVIVTSDHGEIFERGLIRHGTIHLYQPLVKIPLIIFEPGRKSRKDIYTSTSCVDVLPTLLHLTGHSIPGGLEGEVLPPYRNIEVDPNRGVYALRAKLIPDSRGPLTSGTMMMIKDQMKAIRYFGYRDAYDFEIKMESDPFYEVYDLLEDPEEMNNLTHNKTPEIQALIDESEEKFHEVSGARQ